jgi:hypothetical protein
LRRFKKSIKEAAQRTKAAQRAKNIRKNVFSILKKVFFSGIRGLGYNITEESIRSFV